MQQNRKKNREREKKLNEKKKKNLMKKRGKRDNVHELYMQGKYAGNLNMY